MANTQALINSDWPLEQKVAGLLQCVAQEMKVGATRAIEHTGLSLPQLMLLHALDQNPKQGLTVNQLKEQMLDESSNVSRALNKLVEAGYVVKNRDDKDQRVVYIFITEAGHQAHVEADQCLLANASLGLNQGELESAYQVLVKLAQRSGA